MRSPKCRPAILRCRASAPRARLRVSVARYCVLFALFVVYLGTVRIARDKRTIPRGDPGRVSTRARSAGSSSRDGRCIAECDVRYLEVQSSGRRDEVRLHYVAAGAAAARVEAFPFRLADGAWHRLALSVSGAQATLLLDCHPLYRRLIQPPDRNFTQPQLSLWIGQRNSKHSLFKVCHYYNYNHSRDDSTRMPADYLLYFIFVKLFKRAKNLV